MSALSVANPARYACSLGLNGSTCGPELYSPRLEALLQALDQRLERDALRGGPDALLLALRDELHRMRRAFLRSSGADPHALTEAGALQWDRMGVTVNKKPLSS